MNNQECERMFLDAGYHEAIPNIFLCAGWPQGGKDSCEVKYLYKIMILIKLIYPKEVINIFKSNIYFFKFRVTAEVH